MPGTVQQNGRWDRRQDWAGVTRHCTNHRAHGLTPMPHYAANSCTEDNAAWGATSGLLWPRNQYPGAIIPSKASAACSRGSTARGPMSAKAPRDGLASAPTEPQLPTTSSRDDLHVPRTGQRLPVTMLSTVHIVDTHASLCCQLLLQGQRSMGSHVWATVASESVPRANNSPQGLDSLLHGLGSLRVHDHRAPHDGSASASAEPLLPTTSLHGDQHVARHVLHQAVLEPHDAQDRV